jgi:hypothetical protein
VIDRAYRTAEGLGIPLWCEDEAGPYQAIPQPGASWQPEGQPAHRPHEYVRGGTAKLLTLFRPATGAVRAQPVARTPNTVLHPWVQQEMTTILADLPPVPDPAAPERQASAWWWGTGEPPAWLAALPPVRLLLIWDNLAGHRTPALVEWLLQHGVWVLPTPLGGSWLNLAEAIQRIVVRRALDGQHPTTVAEIMTWLSETVAGWNADPTPFAWGGKRAARRVRARERRHALGGAAGYTRRSLPRRRRPVYQLPVSNGTVHDN